MLLSYMLKIIGYIIALIIIFHILWFAYVKLKYKFWSMQPVFHYYQWWYWFYPIGILENDLPKKNRYVNLKNIITYKFHEIDKIHLQNYIFLIKTHFLNYKQVKFNPKKNNIVDYFKSNNISPYFTFFFEKEKIINEKQDIVEHNKIIGGMTSRVLNVYIKNKEPFNSYYVDYLCVDKNKRKQNVAPQIIQTHIYNVRRYQSNIKTFLFKKDQQLNNIVPLTIYLTNSYNISDWILPSTSHPSFHILNLNKQTLQLFFEFIDENNPFKCYISCNPENLLHLIETKNIFGFIVREHSKVIGIYLFRNPTTLFNDEKVYDLFFSISSNDKNKQKFIYGFQRSLFECYKKENFKYLSIENISHNNYLINSIKYKIYKIFPTAYYFYNYINKPFFPNDVAIIH